MWDFKSNSDNSISDFSSEISKDITSQGSAKSDFEKVCSQFKIIPCPYVYFVDVTCKILNCQIDLSNWRAVLLTCSAINSPIKELLIHGCSLSEKHISELTSALEKSGTIYSLKLDYITNENFVSIAPSYITTLLSGNTLIEYLSLKGNQLDDEFITSNSKQFSENTTLKALNLSENKLSDLGASELLRILPFSISLKYISLKRNKLSGKFFDELTNLVLGRPISSVDDQIIKAIAKNVVDRNKSLKDINKKRKKAGYPDIPELTAPTDRVSKIGADSLLLNRSILNIDLSWNDIDLNDFEKFIQDLSAKEQLIKDSNISSSNLICKILGHHGENFIELAKTYQVTEQYNLKMVIKNSYETVSLENNS